MSNSINMYKGWIETTQQPNSLTKASNLHLLRLEGVSQDLPYWIETGVELLVYFWHLKSKSSLIH